MNWDRIEGKWMQYKGKVQTQWGKLTSDDLDVINGNRKVLIGKLRERYGIEEDNAESQVKNFEKTLQ